MEELSIVWTALYGGELHAEDAVDWGFDGTAHRSALLPHNLQPCHITPSPGESSRQGVLRCLPMLNSRIWCHISIFSPSPRCRILMLSRPNIRASGVTSASCVQECLTLLSLCSSTSGQQFSAVFKIERMLCALSLCCPKCRAARGTGQQAERCAMSQWVQAVARTRAVPQRKSYVSRRARPAPGIARSPPS